MERGKQVDSQVGTASGNSYLGLHLLYLSEFAPVSVWNTFFALTAAGTFATG